jgi:hypothetical protein
VANRQQKQLSFYQCPFPEAKLPGDLQEPQGYPTHGYRNSSRVNHPTNVLSGQALAHKAARKLFHIVRNDECSCHMPTCTVKEHNDSFLAVPFRAVPRRCFVKKHLHADAIDLCGAINTEIHFSLTKSGQVSRLLQ